MNVELLRTAVKNIEDDPAAFDMSLWFNGRIDPETPIVVSSKCGTKACLAGHIIAAAKATVADEDRIDEVALDLVCENVYERTAMTSLFYDTFIESPEELKKEIIGRFPDIRFES